ncbi:MAG: WG repeat-containing protein [Planctomycetota bacterium]
MKISVAPLLCLTFILASLHLYGAQEETNPLFLIRQNNRYGYIDKTGKIVIKPQFRFASGFSEGLASVELWDGYRGYIDKTGQVVIKITGLGGDFSDGVAQINTALTFGCIDKTGGYVIKPQSDMLPASSKGYRAEFSEGLLAVYIPSTELYGYIDKTGQFVIKPQFRVVHNFSEGLAAASFKDMTYGYIDKTGQVVIKPRFGWARDFSEGLARVPFGTHSSYIDKTGKFAIESCFNYASPFSEGLAAVQINENDKFGYIDKTGTFIIEPQFEDAESFSEGLAWVRFGIRSGYIDKKGQTVFKLPYPIRGGYWRSGFHNGLAEIAEYSWIDKSGRFVWKSDELRMVEWRVRGVALFVFLILALFVGLLIKKYRRSKKQTGPV